MLESSTSDSKNSMAPTAPATPIEPLSLAAHGTLERWLRMPPSSLEVEGTASFTALASLLLAPNSNKTPGPHLVIVARPEDTKRLNTALRFFDPTASAHELPAFDVGVYSNLYPNRRLIAERMSWLHKAQNARPGEIFVASVEALLQRTLPFEVLAQSAVTLKLRDDLPQKFQQRLEDLGYSQVPMVEDVGTYSIRGGIFDIFSPS